LKANHTKYKTLKPS